MSQLNWKLLTKKRGSSTQGLPPGKEALAWVTNTVTLVYGDRNAVLVDTLGGALEGAVGLGHGERQEAHNDLYHPCPRRPFLRS